MRHLLVLLSLTPLAQAHDVITTAMTFNREISRILNERCVACHRDGGTAFPMHTYAQARPWAVAIKEEILRRRMPPWGAVKGFGEFRNDQGLSAEELEMLISWIDGGVPEGKDGDLPEQPKFPPGKKDVLPKGAIAMSGEHKLLRPMRLDGVQPKSIPDKTSIRMYAELPNGTVEPLVWLDQYRPEFAHPFLFRQPLTLPAGTVIRGLPSAASMWLLPAK